MHVLNVNLNQRKSIIIFAILLGVVKSVRSWYNATENICDKSQKFSVERRMMIWKSRETSI